MNSLTSGTLDQIVAQFQSQASAWGGAFGTVATALFWTLFAIEFVISGIGVALQRDLFGDWIAWLVRQILAAGFWSWVLSNATTFATDIVQSLQQIAQQAGAAYMTPSTVFNAGVNVASTVANQVSILHPADSAGLIICAVIILLGFVAICAWMIVTLVEAWFLCGMAALFMAFGALGFARDVAISFLRFALGAGFKLLTLQLLVGIGSNFIKNWGQATGNGSMTYQGIFIMIGVTITLAALTKMLPDLVQRVVLGSSMSLAHYSHVTSAAVAAASVAAAPVIAATGSIALAGTAARYGVEQLAKRDEEGTAPSGRARRTVAAVGYAAGGVARAGLTNLGNRLGGRIGGRGAAIRMAMDLAHQRQVSQAERKKPSPGESS